MRATASSLLALTVTAWAAGLASCGDDDDTPPRVTTAPPTPAADAPLLAQSGELADGDPADGRGPFDRYFVEVRANDRLIVTLTSSAFDPIVEVTPPGSGTLVNDDYQGDRTRSRLELVATQAGQMKVEVRSYALQGRGAYRVEVRRGSGAAPTVDSPAVARAHHQFDNVLNQVAGTQPSAVPNSAPRPLPVRVGDRLSGNLSASDGRAASGEFFDVYELAVQSPAGEATIELESSAFDAFLRVEGPGGQTWENDDDGGTLNSRVHVPLTAPGTYRIVATSYRAAESGPYDLKVNAGARPAPAAPIAAGPTPTTQSIAGELAEGDSRLQSGEFSDEHRFTWPAGARVHIEAQSSDFDTYLIVHPPSGAQRDNDDMTPGQSLNAGLDLQVDQAGEYRVIVTSYRAGETGRYTLLVGGATDTPSAPAPVAAPQAPAAPSGPPVAVRGRRAETGTLAQGDSQLRSGEFSDTYTMTFPPQRAVTIRLESNDFDSYLIVRSPSGHQEDNDDIQSGALHSGIDVPVSEPGNYQIIVTSYRPGETGRYTLTVAEGPSVVQPVANPTPTPSPAPGPNGTPAANPTTPSTGGRVWGLFAGITDYPGSTNDLPECANDARKLAEAVRNQGNMPADQEFLLTDAQATTAAIRQALTTIASRIRPDDVLVFFYSGHGGQTDGSRDSRELDGRDEYLVAYDGNLMDDELGQLFDRLGNRVSLVAIDACFAGGFGKDIITRPGRVGMFSSEEDVTSAVADRFQAGGYLSHFLRLGIQGEADNDPHNAILTVGELTHYTWVQFGRHASDVRMSMGYQHLVVDRGAVRTSEVLWAVRR